MGTVGHLVALAMAVLISAQVLMLMERRRSKDERLRDLGWGGEALWLLVVAMLTVGVSGAVVGSLLGDAGLGAAAGLVFAVLGWTLAVIWAHRRPEPPARHRDPE